MKEDVIGRSVAAARRKYLEEKRKELAGEQRREDVETKQVEVSEALRTEMASRDSSTFEKKIERNFRNIAQMIVRHGNATYTDYGNGQFLPVGMFLIQSLRDDSIVPTDPLIQKIFDEYEAHFMDKDFDTAKFFAGHPDQQLATFAADLLIDEYATAKPTRTEDNYAKQAYRLLNELKFNVCDKRLRTELDMDFALRKALLEARAVFARERNN